MCVKSALKQLAADMEKTKKEMCSDVPSAFKAHQAHEIEGEEAHEDTFSTNIALVMESGLIFMIPK